MPQSEINATLLSLAKSGKRVARLKGGDPFIFGRGGEEIEGLLTAGVDFEVVPGVTAASGAACYAGIPLTHRDHAQSVRFITGHTKDHQLDLPWQQLMNEQETLVFYMGLAGLAIITRELIRAGQKTRHANRYYRKGHPGGPAGNFWHLGKHSTSRRDGEARGAHTVDYRWRRHAAQFAALVFASAELAFGGLRRLYSR